jgi:hypothetical protein
MRPAHSTSDQAARYVRRPQFVVEQPKAIPFYAADSLGSVRPLRARGLVAIAYSALLPITNANANDKVLRIALAGRR